MEIEQRIKYAFAAFAIASAILAGLGFHSGAHLNVFEIGGRGD